MEMDIKTYLTKHARSARDVGVATAAKNAGLEAAVFAYSQYVEQRGRGDLIWSSDAPITVILDATRLDLWRDVAPDIDWLPAECDRSGWSVGSCSPEWIANTFDPSVMPKQRVGVVTANPFSMKPPERVPVLDNTPLDENPTVAECDYVFRDAWGCDVSGGYLDVTHPETVINRAWDAWNTWDVDRLVVHLMQPHIPFRSRPEWFGDRANLSHFGEPDSPVNQQYQAENTEIWFRIRDGDVDREGVWDAYCDNLRWGLDAVKRLVDAVDVDVLLSSDHGNALGEWGLWSHPARMQTPQLRRVPWVTVPGRGESFDRVEVTEYAHASMGVEEQLSALGYT